MQTGHSTKSLPGSGSITTISFVSLRNIKFKHHLAVGQIIIDNSSVIEFSEHNKMAKLLFVVVFTVALVAIAAGFQQKQLRCADTNTYGSGITNYQLMCRDNIPSLDPSAPVTDLWLDRMQKTERMLDFIDQCTCTLLSMTMVWETMLTHEVEIIFAVSRDMVEEFSKNHEEELAKQVEESKQKGTKGGETQELLTVRRNNPLFAGDDGDSLYHYYVLNFLVRTASSPTKKKNLFNEIIKRASRIYFDLLFLESTYRTTKKFSNDHDFVRIMSNACKDLSTSFGPYLENISSMRAGFKNEMWVYRVVSHDETLYKLVISSMLCSVINELSEERANRF